MPDERPDPDALLERVRAQEERRQRGHLKIFFGATAGVGKTFAMLEAAHKARREGVDVVAGWVETHGRADTAALLGGLNRLRPLETEYRGTRLDEFDLDGALARRPGLLLVDELAHTNAPGSRHPKRWHDVKELLDAGVNVYTTLNVQHLESLNDLVEQVTGVPVRETVPDQVLDEADEVEVIDLPPEELLRRLAEGKVYVPEQARRAVERFFRKGNLIALRELALRRTAEHVDADMQDYRRRHAIEETWPVAERVLVCVRPNPDSVRLVRAARRLAAGLRAPWIAVTVESAAQSRLTPEERRDLEAALKLAEELGAETAVLSGESVAGTLLAYARKRNVSKIVTGKPAHPRWRDRLRGSLLEEIVRGSGEIDVYVISGEETEAQPVARTRARAAPSPPAHYAWAVLAVLVCTLVSWGMHGRFDNSNLIMVYLLGVAFVATRHGRGPAALASALSVAAFDFFFVPPQLTFAVGDTQYLLTFAVMLTVALLISTLAVRVRDQAESAWERERRTRTLHDMSRDLASLRIPEEIAGSAARHVAEVMHGPATVFLPDAEGRLQPTGEAIPAFAAGAHEAAVAEWAFRNGRVAGRGTDTLPGAAAVHLPLVGTHGALGVLAVAAGGPEDALPSQQLDLLEALARQVAAPLERARLAVEAERARVEVEGERFRNIVLSSVSHDLRTPLAAITGAASSLLSESSLTDEGRRELLETVDEESRRLNRLVTNLLDMSRLEYGSLALDRQWHSVEELVGAARERLGRALDGHVVEIALPADLPLVPGDAVLLEQVLVNLLENAARYAPPGSHVRLAAERRDGEVMVEVADDGPGLPLGAEARVFDKFYRAQQTRGGFGLGLAICRAVVEAHGGRIWAEPRRPRGVAFRFTLPVPERPPMAAPPEDGADAA